MAELPGRSLATCPEAFLKSMKCFKASLEPVKHPTTECIEEHIATLISEYVSDLFGDHSPLCILGVGSGDGGNDLSFIEMLSEIGQERDGKCQFIQRTIEPNKHVLEVFSAKTKDLFESLKSKADIKFEWFPTTYQEYVKQQNDGLKFDVVHFFHSLYFLDIETALKHCYEKELGKKGIIVCGIRSEESAFVKYGKAFSLQGLILNPGFYYSNRDVTDVAKRNGWKYVECPGETGKASNITAIFDHSSVEGNLLLDFLTQWVNVGLTAGQENLQKILRFWENECIDNDLGIKKIKMCVRTVIIFKGL